MNVLAFAATNHHLSINKQLIDYAINVFTTKHVPNAVINTIDLNDYEMPIYRQDREAEHGIPEAAQTLFKQIGAADAVIVSYAEHNGSTTAAWKNIFDWMSRIEMKLWQGKPLVFLAASPGPRAGAGVLASQAALAPHFGGDLKATAGIGVWGNAYHADTKTLIKEEDQQTIDSAMSALKE